MKTIVFTSAQNVQVEYELSPVSLRVVAYLLDAIMFIIYFVILQVITGSWMMSGSTSGIAAWFIIAKIPLIFYNPVIEYFTQGQSIGKMIMGIRVVTNNGERPGLREVFTRWIFKGDFVFISADGLSFIVHIACGVVGAIIAITGFKTQRMGDIMASTYVIKNKSSIKYNLKDILSIKNLDSHETQYPQVIRFTDEDMLLIKSTIIRVTAHPTQENKTFAVDLANETASLLGLEEVPEKKFQFLKTVLQDYVVLTR